MQTMLIRLKELHNPNPYVVITGCARSGTQYVARALDALGFKIGHWNMLGEQGVSSDLVVPWQCIDDCLILHQVRDPLRQISSMQTSAMYTWNYIGQILKFTDESLLLKCMKYWYYWNVTAEKRGRFTYRLEDIDNIWIKLLTMVGAGDPYTPLPTISKQSNSRAGMYTPVTWDMLEAEDSKLCGQIKGLAIHYGY